LLLAELAELTESGRRSSAPMLVSLLVFEVLLFEDIGRFMPNTSAAEPPPPASLCDNNLDEGEKGEEEQEE
jgi:hypothetical protein